MHKQQRKQWSYTFSNLEFFLCHSTFCKHILQYAEELCAHPVQWDEHPVLHVFC